MKFNENAQPIYTGDLWYDLTDGGYIKPGDLLSDKAEAKKVEQAIEIVRKFIDEACDAELIIVD